MTTYFWNPKIDKFPQKIDTLGVCPEDHPLLEIVALHPTIMQWITKQHAPSYSVRARKPIHFFEWKGWNGDGCTTWGTTVIEVYDNKEGSIIWQEFPEKDGFNDNCEKYIRRHPFFHS